MNLTPTTPTGIFVLGSMRGIGAMERPRCRKQIIAGKLRPYIGELGFWDGFTARDPSGRKVFLSDGMKLQMGRMLREGYWPELLDPELNRKALDARREFQRIDRRRTHGL